MPHADYFFQDDGSDQAALIKETKRASASLIQYFNEVFVIDPKQRTTT